jgi:hypothetical protein
MPKTRRHNTCSDRITRPLIEDIQMPNA